MDDEFIADVCAGEAQIFDTDHAAMAHILLYSIAD
jgi:hypothetical protein